MFRQHVDVLSFGEIGGVGEMTYHTVRFPRYELRYEGNIALLCPRYEKDDVLIDHQADTLLTGQELLVSLCNLYRAINDPNCKENYIEMIAEWCSSNIHPYAIDTLYDLATDEGYDYESYSGMIMRDGIFAVEDFMRDLAPLYHTTCFHHALLQLINGNDAYARSLYEEGRFTDGYPFFEKYKCPAPEASDLQLDDLLEEMSRDAQATSADSIVPWTSQPFQQNPLQDLDSLQITLLSMFPEFRMKLHRDRKTKRILFAAEVESVFQLAWYALSRSVANDAPDHDPNPNAMFSSGTPLACLHCGNFFIRTGPRQRYCSDPDCQAARQRKNQRNSRQRRKLQEQQ